MCMERALGMHGVTKTYKTVHRACTGLQNVRNFKKIGQTVQKWQQKTFFFKQTNYQGIIN